VIAVTIQSVFRLEIHQNKVIYFFKIIFYISTSKQYKNIKFNLKKLKFLETRHTQSLYLPNPKQILWLK
jgi:hypothetical protein